MRPLLSFTLLAACCLTAQAVRIKNIKAPQWIFSNHPSFVIRHIILTDSSTVLKCHYESKPSARFSIRSSMRLEDENCHTVYVKRVSEFPLDSTVMLPESGRMDFTIQFPPLAVNTRIFDLIEGSRANDFCIYGISCTKKPPVIPHADEQCSDDELSARWFRADSVWLTGDFINYSRNSMPHLGRIAQTSPRISFFDRSQSPQVFGIDDDGHFACGFAVDHPMWQWADLDQNTANPIVFFARPGDSLHVEIKDYGKETLNFTYHYASTRPAYPALMALWGYAMSRQYEESDADYLPTDYLEKVQTAFETRSRLYDYLAGKHHFSPFENRLFKNTLRMSKMLDCLDRQKVLFQERWKQASKTSTLSAVSELYFTPSQMDFLREMDWSDLSIAYTPFWQSFREKWYEATDLQAISHNAFVTQGQEASDNGMQEIAKHIADYLPDIAQPLLDDLMNAIANRWTFPNNGHNEKKAVFTLNDEAVRTFLGSISSQSTSNLTHLLFIDAAQQAPKALNGWYNQRNYLFEDFTDNPNLKVIIVAEQMADSTQTWPWHQRLLSGTPCIFLPTEEFVRLCAAFRIDSFPGDVTVTSEEQILRHAFLSHDERTFRSNLRNYLKRLKRGGE